MRKLGMTDRCRRRFRSRTKDRRGMSSLEVVMVIGVTFPVAVMLLLITARACAALYAMISTMVGWPFL